MIRSLQLSNFKAFEKFRVTCKGDAYLVGPNNAGKSTVIAALRSISNMVRTATREQTRGSYEVDGFSQAGYWFASEQVGLIDENLRHEFHQVETRIKAKFENGTQLEAVWPVEEDAGFFYVLDGAGINLTQRQANLKALPSVGAIPVLSPVDHSEEGLSEKYVRGNLEGRLASRHFRNQLLLLQQEDAEGFANRLEEFKTFAQPWLAELEPTELRLRRGDGKTWLDLHYKERGSRIEKEIFWAGDGMQIWLQILLHVFRLKDRSVVVLDEPDVFLHPDLQRRLVNLLESVQAQTITATHSAEVIGEASDESIVWISKDRRSSVRAPRRDVLFELSTTLGTQFNLRLAKALKTREVVFVEGQDAKILRNLAKTLGYERVVQESGVGLIPLGGFDHWKQIEPFKWLVNEFLEESVLTRVVLDRDFMSDEAVAEMRRELKAIGVNPHIWRMKEIENYLLNPACISRSSGAPTDWVKEALDSCAVELVNDVYAEIQSEEVRRHRKDKSEKEITKIAKERADALWVDEAGRLRVCGGKTLLRLLNRRLQDGGFQSVTARGLATKLKPGELPAEMKTLLRSIEEDAA